MKQQEWEKKFEKEFFPKNAKGKSELVKYQKLLNFVHTNFISREEVERVIEDFKIKNTPKPDYSSKKPMDSMSYNSALTDLKQKLGL